MSYKIDLNHFRSVWLKMSPFLTILLVEIVFDVAESISTTEINKHLELGKQYLAKGQLGDALTHYHAAVEGDPNNYLTYFKRGTVYLALGKAKNAISDFDKVLELKPDFTSARISRGGIHLKQANYDLAQLDFHNVLKVDPYNEEANNLMHQIDPARERVRSAEYHYGNDDYLNAIYLLNEAIETSPWSPRLYELRSEIHMANGDEMSAVSDIKSATKLQSDNTAGYFRLAKLLYKQGYASDALKSVRECLKLHPEHKDCFPLYKKVKKVEKFLTEAAENFENKLYKECLANTDKVLKIEGEVQNIVYEAKKVKCSCLLHNEEAEEAIRTCSEALSVNPEPNLFCDRAEAYLLAELYDDAIRDFKQALEMDGHFERAKEGVQKAENRQKQAEKRDYYKILDVKRTASKKEIVKAYRQMAQKWHPDNYHTDEKMKKIAEKKFIDIAAAKEVLTDDEKRRQFDNGEDPLDPEGGRGGAPNFQHFQTFQGSPFQFRFHFN